MINIRTTFIAALAAGACMAAAATGASAAPQSGATGASAAPQSGVTQDLSARTCRTVTTHTWRHGHRIAIKRTSCSPSYGSRVYHSYAYAPGCRYIMKTRWHDGRRISVRTRVCA